MQKYLNKTIGGNIMYDAIIWDLDGTLIDTTPGVIYAVKYTINEFGLEI